MLILSRWGSTPALVRAFARRSNPASRRWGGSAASPMRRREKLLPPVLLADSSRVELCNKQEPQRGLLRLT